MRFIHFADLHLGVETYGRVDPATGLSTRFKDFLDVFDQLVDFAIKSPVDLVLFCGDAYKSREPSQTQQREFAIRIARLSSHGIPVFLLVGNHDLHNAFNRATAIDIFHTLSVKNVYVSNRPEVCVIPTAHGKVQVASLPWLRRGALLAKDDTKNLSFEEVNRKAEDVLTEIVQGHAAKIDPATPSVLAAHVWVSQAVIGSERQMTLGQEPVLLPGNIANPAFDYVALGHIHKRQVVVAAGPHSPPVVYSGSLERVDFGEAGDEKGFYVVDIQSDRNGAKETSFTFHPVNGRRFVVIDAFITDGDVNPTATILQAVDAKKDEIPDGVVRLNIRLPESLEGQVNFADVKNALKTAFNTSFNTDVQRESRVRLTKLTAEELSPAEALKTYLENRKTPAEQVETLMKYGEQLIAD